MPMGSFQGLSVSLVARERAGRGGEIVAGRGTIEKVG